MQAGQRIVVGVDGSDEARVAVRWAANLAVAEGRGLYLVHCWLWPLFTHDLGPVEGVAGSGLRHSAEAIIEDGVAEARTVAPALDIKTSLVTGSAAYVLEELSRQQRMLVVGSRGIGGFLGLLVGSVSLQLAVTAKCPVVILRSAGNANGPVVVGVDGSAESNMALDDACGLADLWVAPLKILHVQKSMGRFGRGKLTADAETEAKAILDDAVTRARGRCAGPGRTGPEDLAAGSLGGGLAECTDRRRWRQRQGCVRWQRRINGARGAASRSRSRPGQPAGCGSGDWRGRNR